MIHFQVPNHLIIPFGCPKWDIKNIRITGVSTKATYFESETPVAYIDVSKKRALRIEDIESVFPDGVEREPIDPLSATEDEKAENAWSGIVKKLRSNAEVQTESERKFLDLYFQYVVQETTFPGESWADKPPKDRPKPYNSVNWRFAALLPLPQAHLYLTDPLADTYSYSPENMRKVDFAFWTGESIVAVEIDGASHAGSAEHIRKDRLLQRAGVLVIHILNEELLEHGTKVVGKLLPRVVTRFWDHRTTTPWNPLLGGPDDIPF